MGRTFGALMQSTLKVHGTLSIADSPPCCRGGKWGSACEAHEGTRVFAANGNVSAKSAHAFLAMQSAFATMRCAFAEMVCAFGAKACAFAAMQCAFAAMRRAFAVMWRAIARMRSVSAAMQCVSATMQPAFGAKARAFAAEAHSFAAKACAFAAIARAFGEVRRVMATEGPRRLAHGLLFHAAAKNKTTVPTMPTPLPWDLPSLPWDSPNTWDGMMPDPILKRMNTIKAIIDFSRYTAADLGPVAQHIHDSMTANAATFPSPPVTMATLATQNADYNTKLAARASRATADVIAFRTSRNTLEASLGRLGNFVNGIAQGDAATVNKSGFPSYGSATPTPAGPPPAPENLRIVQGDVSGTVVFRFTVARQSSTNEVQINTTNPMTEADWHTAGIFKGQKAEVGGQTPTTRQWGRVRTVGNKGVMGDWSDVAEIIVT